MNLLHRHVEPEQASVDTPTANVPISMVAGCRVQLLRRASSDGNLGTVAQAIQRSGAGIKPPRRDA